MSGRKRVLLVDADPGTLHVLRNGLTTVLDLVDVVTARDGREAIEILEEQSVDVLVADLSTPVLDGFVLIATVNNRYPRLPVVVLSGTAVQDVDPRLRSLRILQKPTGYEDVAAAVLEALEQAELGQVAGIPLTAVLQLVEADRRSCTIHITSGRRHGRLYFRSGVLVNAFSEDFGAEGEAAARDILGWDDAVIEFDGLPQDSRRLVETPMQRMLIEVAIDQDERRAMVERAVPAAVPVDAPPDGSAVAPPLRTKPTPGAGADPNEEVVMAFDEDTTAPEELSEVGFADESADAPDLAALAAALPRVATENGHEATPQPVVEPHVTNLIEAITRLTLRVRAADDALAAVGEEMAAFMEAQRSFDEVAEAREHRRRELEAFRAEVSRLAREILGRVDGLFDPAESSVREPAAALLDEGSRS